MLVFRNVHISREGLDCLVKTITSWVDSLAPEDHSDYAYRLKEVSEQFLMFFDPKNLDDEEIEDLKLSHQIMVAYDNNQEVGFSICQISAKRKEVELDYLFASPIAREKKLGVGSGLMKQIIKHYKIQGTSKIKLEAVDGTADFYKKFGFKAIHSHECNEMELALSELENIDSDKLEFKTSRPNFKLSIFNPPDPTDGISTTNPQKDHYLKAI